MDVHAAPPSAYAVRMGSNVLGLPCKRLAACLLVRDLALSEFGVERGEVHLVP